ncbi:unnamed protein product, partial [Dicrocoelium dendriticum]
EVDLVSPEPDQGYWSSSDEVDAARLLPYAISHLHSSSAEDKEPDQSSSTDVEGEVYDDMDEENELEDRASGSVQVQLVSGKHPRSRSNQRVSSKTLRTDRSGMVSSS